MRKLLSSALLVLLLSTTTLICSGMESDLKIGTCIEMGTYYDAPILWRCVSFEKIKGYDTNGFPIMDATDTVTEPTDGYLPLMLSEKIISIKVFDAKSSTKDGDNSHSRRVSVGSGSNYWKDSNIRSWLNSDKDAGYIDWLCGNPPSSEYVYNGQNAYDQEAGFLTNFTPKERAVIRSVSQKAIVAASEYDNGIYDSGNEGFKFGYHASELEQNYATAYAEQVIDKFFLLDVKQLTNIKSPGRIYAYLTAEAIANNAYDPSSISIDKPWHYWLRTPNAVYSNDSVRYVYFGDGYENGIDTSPSYLNAGVRPAFFLDPSSTVFTSGDGTESSPYRISNPYSIQDLGTAENCALITINKLSLQEGFLIVASFTAENELVDVTTQKIAATDGKINCFNLPLNTENATYVSAFVWNNLAGEVPLSEKYSITLP